MPTAPGLSPIADIAAQIAEEVAGTEPPKGSGVSVDVVASQVHKGQPVALFDQQSIAGVSDKAVDCRNYNAIRVAVIAWGTNPSAVLTFHGRDEAGGYPLAIAGPTGSQTVTSSQEIIVPVGAAFVTAELASISGTGAAFTVTATPFILSAAATVALAAGTASVGAVDTELGAARTAAHGLSLPTAPDVIAIQARYNSSTLDLETGNVALGVGITAVGATTTQTGPDLTNHNCRGVKIVLDTTAIGTGSVTISIQGKDATSGKYYTILTGAAVVTNTTNVYTIYPGITAAANVSVSDVLPRTWRVVVTANNANPASYTVGACLIV